jgi:hypothetical protein
MSLRTLWRAAKEWVLPARQLVVVNGDSLPDLLPRRDLVVVRDGHEDWSVGMRCPCGCGQRVELALIPEADPKWQLMVDREARPTLQPSVWLRDGCRSHFYVRSGKVVWV